MFGFNFERGFLIPHSATLLPSIYVILIHKSPSWPVSSYSYSTLSVEPGISFA